jgi:hypothetical protein
MKRSSHWTRQVALVLVALLALGNIAARPQATTLRGTVFSDTNRNGKRDAGEAHLVGIRIQVATTDLTWIWDYYSGDDGTFGPTITQGFYTVRVIPPDGWSVTTESSYTVFVAKGTAVLGLDFGLVQGPGGKSSTGGTTGAPGTLPVTGDEESGDLLADLWPMISLWLIVCGAGFVAITALAPRARRK